MYWTTLEEAHNAGVDLSRVEKKIGPRREGTVYRRSDGTIAHVIHVGVEVDDGYPQPVALRWDLTERNTDRFVTSVHREPWDANDHMLTGVNPRTNLSDQRSMGAKQLLSWTRKIGEKTYAFYWSRDPKQLEINVLDVTGKPRHIRRMMFSR